MEQQLPENNSKLSASLAPDTQKSKLSNKSAADQQPEPASVIENVESPVKAEPEIVADDN